MGNDKTRDFVMLCLILTFERAVRWEGGRNRSRGDEEAGMRARAVEGGSGGEEVRRE